MRAQAAGGRPALALAAYAALRETLADQLGTDPSPETEDAAHRDPARAAAGPLRRAGAVGPGRPDQSGRAPRCARPPGRRRAQRPGGQGRGRCRDRQDDPAGVVVASPAGRGRPGARGDLPAAGPVGTSRRRAGCARRPPARAARSATPTPCSAPRRARSPRCSAWPGRDGESRGVDPALGPATLFAAVTAVLGRIADARGAILVIDDAHLAGQTFADWLGYVQRRPLPVLVVVGARSAEGPSCPPPTRSGSDRWIASRWPSWSAPTGPTTSTAAPAATRSSSPSWRRSPPASCRRRWWPPCRPAATSSAAPASWSAPPR